MQKRLENIIKLIDEKKAEDIQSFNMNNDYFVKYVIIATTLGSKHSSSLIDELKTKLKKEDEKIINIEESENWTIVDLGDILIHLLTTEYRKTYNIEKLLEELNKK